MEFYISGIPTAKKRHRSVRTKFGVRTYDPQHAQKAKDRWNIQSQMREKGFKMACNESLRVDLWVGLPYPKKTPQKGKKGQFVTTKPDIDNFIKYYLDVLNGIAYHDDNLISVVCAEKRYTENPHVNIFLKKLQGDNMVEEHALEVNGEFTIEHIKYLVKKANDIGRSGRTIGHVFVKNEHEIKHIMFDTEKLKPKV